MIRALLTALLALWVALPALAQPTTTVPRAAKLIIIVLSTPRTPMANAIAITSCIHPHCSQRGRASCPVTA